VQDYQSQTGDERLTPPPSEGAGTLAILQTVQPRATQSASNAILSQNGAGSRGAVGILHLVTVYLFVLYLSNYLAPLSYKCVAIPLVGQKYILSNSFNTAVYVAVLDIVRGLVLIQASISPGKVTLRKSI